MVKTIHRLQYKLEKGGKDFIRKGLLQIDEQ